MKSLILTLLLAGSVVAAPVPREKPLDPLGRPLLGVREDPQVIAPDGIVIGEVIAGSAAERAGVKTGDVLLAVGINKATSFSDLQRVIAMYRPGAVVKVELERDRKKLVLMVKLGEREPDPEEDK